MARSTIAAAALLLCLAAVAAQAAPLKVGGGTLAANSALSRRLGARPLAIPRKHAIRKRSLDLAALQPDSTRRRLLALSGTRCPLTATAAVCHSFGFPFNCTRLMDCQQMNQPRPLHLCLPAGPAEEAAHPARAPRAPPQQEPAAHNHGRRPAGAHHQLHGCTGIILQFGKVHAPAGVRSGKAAAAHALRGISELP